MSGRPRKGTRVVFTRDEGAGPATRADTVAGLRFTIEARYGGSVLVDLVDIMPRPLAIAFAAALRRLAGVGGALGAASTIKQHLQAYRWFFAYLREHASSVRGPTDLRPDHLDGYDAALEASGRSSLFRHALLAKPIIALRSIDAEHPGLLDPTLRDRLMYTSPGSVGRSRPRDAYSPFVARQLRDAARADVTAIVRRLCAGPLLDGDERLRKTAAAAHTIIADRGVLTDRDPEYWLLYHARHRRGLIDRAHPAFAPNAGPKYRCSVPGKFRRAGQEAMVSEPKRAEVEQQEHRGNDRPRDGLLRLQRIDRRRELNHRLRRVPHALKVRVELRGGVGVADHDQVVVLFVLAARAEVRRARPQNLPVDRVSLLVHDRAAALDPHIVGEIAEVDEILGARADLSEQRHRGARRRSAQR